jgi:Mlc titration factor MtfA (ptsG expression regulator)
MFAALRSWRRRRTLERNALPDALWEEGLARLPFLSTFSAEDLARLRDLVVLFLSEKSIVGAHGFEVTPLMRVVIAMQACVLVLGLDLDWYAGWEGVVIYPDEFVTDYEYTDEAGVVHRVNDAMAGEALAQGPVLLSWADIEASSDWHHAGMNLVVHEFAHKLDMLTGEADGAPPLHPGMSRETWRKVFTTAYEDFCARVDDGEDTAIDPYAADAPAEFFAVCSEVFFAEPELLEDEYPEVREQLAAFYRQRPKGQPLPGARVR